MSRDLHLGYVVYWGALEPLGRAVAVPVVEAFARRAQVTFVTFEKPGDLVEEEDQEAMAARLEAAGVRWLPLRYTKRPRGASAVWDAFRGRQALGRVHRRSPLDVVQGRTYVGGLVGMLAARRTGAPFVYYHDACWPEEQVDAGIWPPESRRYRAARAVEDRMFLAARGVVVLTEQTRRRLGREERVPDHVPTEVVRPTSGLIQRSGEGSLRRARAADDLRLVHLGSVSDRYCLGWVLSFFDHVLQERPGSRLTFLAHRDHDLIRKAAADHGVQDALEIRSVPHERVDAEIRSHDAGMVFLREGWSHHCQSPTKGGEYLACGLPVVCNPYAGDVPELVEGKGLGVVVAEESEEAHRRALAHLLPLVEDPDLPARARSVAQERYDLEEGVERQMAMFRRILEES